MIIISIKIYNNRNQQSYNKIILGLMINYLALMILQRICSLWEMKKVEPSSFVMKNIIYHQNIKIMIKMNQSM